MAAAAAQQGSQFFLDQVETPPGRAGDALRCLLHTVLFCRELGPATPGEATVPLLSDGVVAYAKCADAAVDAAVEDSVAHIVRELSRRPSSRTCEVVLALQRPPAQRAGLFGFGGSASKEPFEEWGITLAFVPLSAPPAESPRDRELFAASLRKAVLGALATAAENRAHVPLVQVPTDSVVSAAARHHSASSAIGAAGGRYPFPFTIKLVDTSRGIIDTLFGLMNR